MADGDQQVAPAAAREFAAQFIHDPKVLESMADADVVGYHGRLTQTLDKVRPSKPWADNWREELARGADGKPVDDVVKRLGRYTTPKAVAEALISVQERIGKGELRSAAPPKDATPDQLKAWQTDNGIPEAADKYDIKLPAGLTIGEDDKPIISALFKEMHPAGLSNAMASKFVESYYKVREGQVAAAAQKLAETKQQVEDALRKSWGNDYRANNNLVDAVINSTVPAGSKLGKSIKDTMATNVEFAEFMASVARTINPVTTIIPGADSSNIRQGIDSEIANIQKEMKNKDGPYYKGPVVTKNGRKDTEMAHRYTDLLDAQARTKGG